MKITTLILITLLLQSCGFEFDSAIKPDKKTHNKNINTARVTSSLDNHNYIKPKLVVNNYNNHLENKSLSRLESYLRNSDSLINKAYSVQDEDSRYKFNYQALKQDIADMANSINRFINQDKSSQTPRVFEPLSKRY